MLRLGFWLKTKFIAILMVSLSEMLVKRQVYIAGKKKCSGKICIRNLRKTNEKLLCKTNH